MIYAPIAETLLDRNRELEFDQSGVTAPLRVELVISLLEALILEKEIQLLARPLSYPPLGIELVIEPGAERSFAKLNPVEFKRVISNLINS